LANQQAETYAYSEAEYVEGRKHFMAAELSYGDEYVIFEHIPWLI
jgi:hypothetical protein